MPKATSSRYTRARIRARVRRPKRKNSAAWSAITIAVVAIGVLLIVLSRSERQSEASVAPKLGDHWHAFLGVDACGTWLNHTSEGEGDTGIGAPPFEPRANDPNIRAGLHSHGDGLMHIHPFASDEAGKNATVGRWFTYGGWELNTTSIKAWDGVARSNGQKCGTGKDAKPATLQWKVGHFQKPWPKEARTGNPADFRPKNGDIVAIYFLPKGAELVEPPDAQQALSAISDLGGAPVKGTGTTTPSVPTGDTTPSTAPTSTSTP